MQINLNSTVKVKLTQLGRDRHRSNHYDFWNGVMLRLREAPSYVPPLEDENGWSIWSLWELIQSFGKYSTKGGNLCFESEIDVMEG